MSAPASSSSPMASTWLPLAAAWPTTGCAGPIRAESSSSRWHSRDTSPASAASWTACRPCAPASGCGRRSRRRRSIPCPRCAASTRRHRCRAASPQCSRDGPSTPRRAAAARRGGRKRRRPRRGPRESVSRRRARPRRRSAGASNRIDSLHGQDLCRHRGGPTTLPCRRVLRWRIRSP